MNEEKLRNLIHDVYDNGTSSRKRQEETPYQSI